MKAIKLFLLALMVSNVFLSCILWDTSSERVISIVELSTNWPEEEIGWHATNIAYHNGFVLFVGPIGINCIDVRDPIHPKMVGTFNDFLQLSEEANDLVIIGDALLIQTSQRLMLFDVADLPDIKLLNSNIGPGGSCLSSYKQYAITASGVLDVSDPTSIKTIGENIINSYTTSITGNGRYVIMNGWDKWWDKFIIFDIFNTNTPLYIDTTGASQRVKLSNNYLFVLHSPEGGGYLSLQLYDITSPETPNLLSDVFVPAYHATSAGLDVSGNYLYLARDKVGLLIFDFSDPHSVKIVDRQNPNRGEYFYAVKVVDSLVYLVSDKKFYILSSGNYK